MQAGFAAAPIPIHVDPAHSSEQAEAFGGPPQVRAGLFRAPPGRVCLVSLDGPGLPDRWVQWLRQRVGERTGLPSRCVALLPSGEPPRWLAGSAVESASRLDEAWAERFAQACLEAVEAAIRAAGATAVPVRMAEGMISCDLDELGAQSGQGASDPRLRLLRVDGPEDQPIGVLFHHPFTLAAAAVPAVGVGWHYPELIRREIESVLTCRAIFLPGCATPRDLAADSAHAQPTPSPLEPVHRLTHRLIRAVKRLSPSVDQRLGGDVEPLEDRDEVGLLRLGQALVLSLPGPIRPTLARWIERRAEAIAHPGETWVAMRVGPEDRSEPACGESAVLAAVDRLLERADREAV